MHIVESLHLWIIHISTESIESIKFVVFNEISLGAVVKQTNTHTRNAFGRIPCILIYMHISNVCAQYAHTSVRNRTSAHAVLFVFVGVMYLCTVIGNYLSNANVCGVCMRAYMYIRIYMDVPFLFARHGNDSYQGRVHAPLNATTTSNNHHHHPTEQQHCFCCCYTNTTNPRYMHMHVYSYVQNVYEHTCMTDSHHIYSNASGCCCCCRCCRLPSSRNFWDSAQSVSARTLTKCAVRERAHSIIAPGFFFFVASQPPQRLEGCVAMGCLDILCASVCRKCLLCAVLFSSSFVCA